MEVVLQKQKQTRREEDLKKKIHKNGKDEKTVNSECIQDNITLCYI